MRLVDVHAGAIQSAAVLQIVGYGHPSRWSATDGDARACGLCNSAWAAESRCPAIRPQISITDRSDHARHTKRLLQLRRFRIEARGEPIRAGICHCTTCRKESGGPFMAFAVWHADHVKIEGRTASWKATRDDRHFCPFCGSTLFGVEEGTKEIEVRLGAFDAAPTDLVPTYELWVRRRERWLQVLSSREQFAGDRTEVG